jgi:hypothetical protein
MRYYFETSAAEFLTKVMRGMDAIATKTLQQSKGNCWSISSIVLWETMQIPDFKDYDSALYMISALFDDKLIKSPTEIIIDYINNVPISRDYELETKSAIGISWRRACLDKSFSFNIHGSEFLEITKMIKMYSRYLPFVCGIRRQSEQSVPNAIAEIKEVVDTRYIKIFNDNAPALVSQLRKLCMYVVLVSICYGIDISEDVIDEYWSDKNIDHPIDRFNHISQNYRLLFSYGPVWNIANCIYSQCVNVERAGRGVYHDGLHSVYLPFFDFFITADEHFVELRERVTKDMKEKLYRKIYHIRELKFEEQEHDAIFKNTKI